MSERVITGFNGLFQAAPSWCWAAVTASIYNYYGTRGDGFQRQVLPQCDFIRDFYPFEGCLCTSKVRTPSSCMDGRQPGEIGNCVNLAANSPKPPDIELERYGLLKGIIAFDGSDQIIGGEVYHGGFDWAVFWANIDEGSPIVLRVRVGYRGRRPSHHAIIVYGYHEYPQDQLIIWDPLVGERHMTVQQITSVYGPIVQAFLTRQTQTDVRTLPTEGEAITDRFFRHGDAARPYVRSTM